MQVANPIGSLALTGSFPTTGRRNWSTTLGSFNLAGDALSARDPSGFITETRYDGLGRAIVVQDAEGRMTRSVYDALGRPTKVIRAWAGNLDGTGATLNCDAMHAATESWTGPEEDRPLQQCYQRYAYTVNGQIEMVMDAGGNVTRYAYDGFDRLSATYFPDKEQKGQWSESDYESYTYDANGNMLTKRTRSGQVVTYTYDNLNRLTVRHVPGADGDENYTFDYDLAGRRTGASEGAMSQSWAYDLLGRLTTQTTNGVMPVSYAYDAASNLTQMTYPDGWAVDFAYDALSRVKAANHGGANLATLGYDTLSRRQSLSYGNGTCLLYTSPSPRD